MSETLFPEETPQQVTTLPAALKKIADDLKFPLSKAEKYAVNYMPYFVEIKDLTDKLRGLDKNKPEDAEQAKRVKLDFGKLCSRLEKTKKEDKAEYVIITKYIDGLYNAANGAARLTQAEAEGIATFLEKQREIAEAKLHGERVLLIGPYVEDVNSFQLGKLTETAFNELYEAHKKKFEDKQKFLERLNKSKQIAFDPVQETPPLEEEKVVKSLVVPSGGFSSTGGFGGPRTEPVQAKPSNITPSKPVKILFYDLETTGVNYWQHGIHQISGALEVDGVVKESFDIKLKPHESAIIDPEALKVSGLTPESLVNYQDCAKGYQELMSIIQKHVDQYDKTDKMFLCGYNNASFDDNFFRRFFELNGNKYFGSYFYGDALDVRVLAAFKLKNVRHTMENFKLKTVAKQLGIQVDETKLHDALYDNSITREAFYRLQNI